MDSTAKIVKPNLSGSLEPGTNALNAYHLAGQLLVVYGLIDKISIQEETKSRWLGPEMTLVENIGELYEVWNAIKDQGNYGIAIAESPAIRRKIFGLSHRLDQIQNSVNSWTSIIKMPSLLMKCEIRWQRIIESFLDANENCTIKVTSLMADSRERHNTLQELLRYYQSEKEAFEFSSADVETEITEVSLDD